MTKADAFSHSPGDRVRVGNLVLADGDLLLVRERDLEHPLGDAAEHGVRDDLLGWAGQASPGGLMPRNAVESRTSLVHSGSCIAWRFDR